MAFNIRKVPMPGTAEADVSALFGKLAGWLAGDGRLARDDERARIEYIVKALSGIQNKLYEEREERGALTADFPGGVPAVESAADIADAAEQAQMRTWNEAASKIPTGDARHEPAREAARENLARALLADPLTPESAIPAALNAQDAAYEAAPADIVDIPWDCAATGDEVYSEVTGSWWEVVEGMADRGDSQVTIANAEAGKTVTFPPNADDIVHVRRGTLGAATDALRAGGLDVGAVA